MKNTNAYRVTILNMKQSDSRFMEFAHGTASILTTEEIEMSAGIENSQIEVLFLIIDPMRFEQLINLYTSLDILIDAEDITNKIINNTIPDELKIIKSNDFMVKRVNELIKCNIDKDFVLDKILSHGMDSLSSIELDILAS